MWHMPFSTLLNTVVLISKCCRDFLLNLRSFVPFTSACPPLPSLFLCIPLSLYVLPCVLHCLWGHEIAPQLLGISCAFLLRLPSLTHCLLCLSVFVCLICSSFAFHILKEDHSLSLSLHIPINHYLSLIKFKFQPSQCTVGPIHHNVNIMVEETDLLINCVSQKNLD